MIGVLFGTIGEVVGIGIVLFVVYKFLKRRKK